MAFRDFLYYSKSDRRSIVVLSLIAIVLVGVLVLKSPDGEAPAVGVADSTLVVAEKDTLKESRSIVMHEFDPNTVDSVTLLDFGLSPRQARAFLNYRRAGAVFRSAQSIERVYTLTVEDVERLLPYVRIGEEYSYKPKVSSHHDSHAVSVKAEGKDTARKDTAEWQRRYPEKFTSLTKVDPNTADTALLQRIPGVGSWISRNIVDERKRLGGFHSVDQLLEVKYFSPELLEWFEINPATLHLEKINVNKASFQQLNSHPYISYEQTRDLLRYMRLYGRIDDIGVLRRTGIFTDAEVDKLAPYVEF